MISIEQCVSASQCASVLSIQSDEGQRHLNGSSVCVNKGHYCRKGRHRKTGNCEREAIGVGRGVEIRNKE